MKLPEDLVRFVESLPTRPERDGAKSPMWVIGDWLLEQETEDTRFNAAVYALVRQKTGYSKQYVQNAKWVCKKFPARYRHPYLGPTHAEQIVRLPKKEWAFVAQQVSEHRLSVGWLRDYVFDYVG